MGSLLEDGLSYKESFVVRSYEVGINKTATVETIANLLQVRARATGSPEIRR
jgi:fatty acyl-ACP thioesterase A